MTEKPIEPPTIAHLRSLGLKGLWVSCTRCKNNKAMLFDALNLPEETPFPAIGTKRRFVCSVCGAREVSLMPDWRDYALRGGGF